MTLYNNQFYERGWCSYWLNIADNPYTNSEHVDKERAAREWQWGFDDALARDKEIDK